MAFQAGLKTSSIKRSISWVLKGFHRKWTAPELLAASVSCGLQKGSTPVVCLNAVAAALQDHSQHLADVVVVVDHMNLF